MGYSKTIALLAGAAMGLTTSAQAQSLDQVRAYNAQAAANAEGYTSTLASSAVSGPTISGQIQFRYYLNWRDDNTLSDDLTNGFQTRRTKLEASGEVADGWSYFVQLAADFDGGGIGLQEAWVKYKVSDTSDLTWGQFKLPLLREELVSSKRQLAMERSVTNETFTQDRSQGIQYGWNSDNVKVRVAFSDGLNTENTDFTSGTEADWAFTGRVDYLGAGQWSQFDDFTSWRGSNFAWMIGGAAHYQSGGSTVGTLDADLFQITVDGSVEGDGWNAFAAFIYRMLDVSGGVDADDFGFVVQGGYFVHDQVEVFARWDAIFLDDNSVLAPNADTALNFITVGANYFPFPDSDAARITADLVFALDETTGLVNPLSGDSRTGLLGDPSSGEVDLRIQFQLKF